MRDAFIGGAAKTLMDLPQGARVGSASLRRQAMIRRLRPDLQVELLRGNVQTRLRKVESGEFAATLLALAGLKRLGLADKATSILPLDQFPPACGQGAIAITARTDDARIQRRSGPRSATPKPAMRWRRNGLFSTCSTAPAARRSPATPSSPATALSFYGLVLRKDGSEAFDARPKARSRTRRPWAKAAARQILAAAPADLLQFLTSMRVLVTRPRIRRRAPRKKLAGPGPRGRGRAGSGDRPDRRAGSGRAVRSRPGHQRPGFRGDGAARLARPAACVGEKTAQAARGAGLAVILSRRTRKPWPNACSRRMKPAIRALSGGTGAQARAGGAPARSGLAA